MGVQVPLHRSLTMPLWGTNHKRNFENAVSQILRENNRILVRRCRFYIFQLASDIVVANGRQLSQIEEQNLMNNDKYLSNYYMSDEE